MTFASRSDRPTIGSAKPLAVAASAAEVPSVPGESVSIKLFPISVPTNWDLSIKKTELGSCQKTETGTLTFFYVGALKPCTLIHTLKKLLLLNC